jgi:hypothetical protein
MRKAAIVPYNVSENSIIYISEEWEDLRKLLISPTEFLGAEGMKCSDLRWSLLANCTVILEHMESSDLTTLRFGASKNTRPDGVPAGGGGETGDQAIAKMAQQVRDKLNGPAAGGNGSFMAEFAVYTKTLYIRYQLPPKYRFPQPKEPKDKCRFKGNLEPPTLVSIDQQFLGNLHFDIERRIGFNETHRADQILDFIENPYRVFNSLKPHTLKIATPGNVDSAPGVALTHKLNPVTTQRPYFFSEVRPTIIIEGASRPDLPDESGICIDGQTVEVDINGVPHWCISGVLYKSYVGPAVPSGTCPVPAGA